MCSSSEHIKRVLHVFYFRTHERCSAGVQNLLHLNTSKAFWTCSIYASDVFCKLCSVKVRQQLDTERSESVCVCLCQWGKVVGSTLVERGLSVIPHYPHLNPNPRS